MENEIKEFWEWCGWHIEKFKDREYYVLYNPNGHAHASSESKDTLDCLWPELDLNNLFRWAVPKLIKLGYEIILSIGKEMCEVELNDSHIPPKLQSYLGQDKDPAQALYKAISKVIKERE